MALGELIVADKTGHLVVEILLETVVVPEVATMHLETGLEVAAHPEAVAKNRAVGHVVAASPDTHRQRDGRRAVSRGTAVAVIIGPIMHAIIRPIMTVTTGGTMITISVMNPTGPTTIITRMEELVNLYGMIRVIHTASGCIKSLYKILIWLAIALRGF